MDANIKQMVNETEFLLDDCETLIKYKLKDNNFEIIDFQTAALEEKCGYFGDHYRIKIKINHKNKTEVIYCFEKCIPNSGSGIDFNLAEGAFAKEIFIYETAFKNIVNSGISCLKTAVPKCYFTKSNMLVLEDLSKSGFQPIPRYEYLNYDHVAVIINSLAKIHASSLIYEEKKSEYLLKSFLNFDDTFYSKKKGHKGTMSLFAALKGIYTEIDLFNFASNTMTNLEFKKRVKNACNQMCDLVKPSKKYRNVICHGDLWQTNFMMKYEEASPTRCIIVDFQTARYAPPAHDVMAFLYLTTSREFRKQHFKEIIDLYYSELCKNVDNFGFDLNVLLPFGEFIESCEQQKIFAAVQAATYFQLTQAKSEAVAEFAQDLELWEKALYEDHSILILEFYKSDPDYRYRLEESLMDLEEVCANMKN